jgi:hypothetical protein
MPTLDELDRRCVYIDDKERFLASLYRRQAWTFHPRALRRSKVVYIMKDGIVQKGGGDGSRCSTGIAQ